MYHQLKKDVHILLHPELGNSKWDKIVNGFIITLIVLNVIALMLETIQPLYVKYKPLFDTFDLVSVIIFSVEYVLRVWSCNVENRYRESFKGRIKYMLTPGALIDLMAFFPWYLHNLIGFDPRFVRILRLLRFFRLFRLTAYTRSAQMIFNVFRSRLRELLLSLLLAVFLIIISSCILYFAEHNVEGTQFTSIPATLWWAVVTLTTTGYGDMFPATIVGRALAGVIMLTGVAFLALPAGIITAGFLDEMRILRKGKSYKCPHCGGDISSFVHKHHLDEEGH
jgi:voltage-gated potassium channel